MLLELMSNGTLAELPPENTPAGISIPDEPSVMLLLPHNKYLLGTGSDKWIYAGGNPDSEPRNVYLYDDQVLSLRNEGTDPIILPARTVNALRKELFLQSDPPGSHVGTVMMLRTFMKTNPVFNSDGINLFDEKAFSEALRNDEVLCKSYWALRFALSRSEMETVTRLKAWLKAGPELFKNPKYTSHLWFSLLGLPDEESISEIEELSFSKLELQRMTAQNCSPLVVYNPLSGWLVLGRFGRDSETIFFVWAFLDHEFWHELREKKKMTVHDIIHAVWGERETQEAMTERAKYKGADDVRI